MSISKSMVDKRCWQLVCLVMVATAFKKLMIRVTIVNDQLQPVKTHSIWLIMNKMLLKRPLIRQKTLSSTSLTKWVKMNRIGTGSSSASMTRAKKWKDPGPRNARRSIQNSLTWWSVRSSLMNTWRLRNSTIKGTWKSLRPLSLGVLVCRKSPLVFLFGRSCMRLV